MLASLGHPCGAVASVGRKDGVMGIVTKLALAGATALVSTAAFAADLPSPRGPYIVNDPVAVEAGGWYLRGDVGVGVQTFSNYNFTQTNIASGAVWPATWQINQHDIKDATII